MSRSTRKPYAYITGGSPKVDRKVAARLFRRLENRSLRKVFVSGEFEDYMHPVQYEAAGNDPWGWGVDGLAGPVEYPTRFDLTQLGLGDVEWMQREYEYFLKVQRK